MNNIAIYSRKSVFTNKGDSIENQIELCKNYCNSYMNDEDINFIVYEDEGFSGKDTKRPMFQKLISDIKSKKINTLICYRLDRISRNVSDFSGTLELLQKYNVSFISIKERFDTSTPLGRAMIYIASVFAQLERETIAERVRDNMIMLSKSGRWLGGTVPFGFDSKKITYLNDDLKEKTMSELVLNKSEIQIVKFIYDSYLNYHSISKVTKILNENKYKGKFGGCFDKTNVRRILRNPIYVISDENTHSYLISQNMNVFGKPNGNGYLIYNKSKQTSINNDISEWIVTVSNHKGIISSNDWLAIQKILNQNKRKASSRSGTGKNHALFSGIIKCAKCGADMIVTFSGRNPNNDNKPYEYYSCPNKINKPVNKCLTKSIRVDLLDKEILSKINIYNHELIINTLKKYSSNNKYNLSNDEINITKKEILQKEEQSQNLIVQLSKSSSESLSSKIINTLNTLDDDISFLKKKLLNIENQKIASSNTPDINIQNLISSISNFDKTINIITDMSQKKFLIQSFIKCAIWNSDTFTVEIIYEDNKY